MTPEQLDQVVARTGHERFRWLTSDDNPDVAQRESYRAAVARMAAGPPPAAAPPPPLPPIGDQLVGLARSLGAWARSGFALASSAEVRRRRAVCRSCPLLVKGRCTACGCMVAVKPWLGSATCPQGKWEPPAAPAGSA